MVTVTHVFVAQRTHKCARCRVQTANQKLEVSQIFTIEPGLAVPDHGYIGLEEDVVMTENGAE